MAAERDLSCSVGSSTPELWVPRCLISRSARYLWMLLRPQISLWTVQKPPPTPSDFRQKMSADCIDMSRVDAI